jgi:hypothetical protein
MKGWWLEADFVLRDAGTLRFWIAGSGFALLENKS